MDGFVFAGGCARERGLYGVLAVRARPPLLGGLPYAGFLARGGRFHRIIRKFLGRDTLKVGIPNLVHSRNRQPGQRTHGWLIGHLPKPQTPAGQG